MVSYYVTFVVTVYGEFFGEPNSSPHKMSGGFKPACKTSSNPCALDIYKNRIPKGIYTRGSAAEDEYMRSS